MKTLLVTLICMCVFYSAVAQNTTVVQSPSGLGSSAQGQMPAGIELALKKYVSATERRSMQELLAIWPDLQNQKKDFGKIKQHFDDPNVSNEHLTLLPSQTQTLKDDAIVQCERTEHFAKTEATQTGGDLMMNSSPAQTPPPGQTTKQVKKTEKVWVKLHKKDDDWVIVSVSQKPLSF